MKSRFCYWSVCDNGYADLMARCVASARRMGVFNTFHALTNRVITDCECYDAQQIEKTDSLFKLIYLKEGMSKLAFEYFIWIDADTQFLSNPNNLLDCLNDSPIHVPLTTNLSALTPEHISKATGASQYVALMKKAGVQNAVYSASSAFWIVHRDVIDLVWDLALHYRTTAQGENQRANATDILAYAMQMLCGNPASHLASCRPDLWASDDSNQLNDDPCRVPGWQVTDPLTGESYFVNPSIAHRPHTKNLATSQTEQLEDFQRMEIPQNKPGEERSYACNL